VKLEICALARMIRPKGIAEAVAAVVRARKLGANVDGAPDPANPTSYSQADLRRWVGTPGIAWHGATEDGASIHCEHRIAMPPAGGRSLRDRGRQRHLLGVSGQSLRSLSASCSRPF
jgi:hypothetical protein